jgi:hypothetical protein
VQSHDQEIFARALRDNVAPYPGGITPARRFDIHRNNVYASLIACLVARYPVVQRLVGADFFAQCARDFVVKHPPISPVLQEYGGSFADFLADLSAVRHLPYLPDVARLEWQRLLAQHGPDATPLHNAALAAVAPEEMAQLVFDVHPTVRILTSRYPIATIWQTNSTDAVTRAIPADAPGETVLIVRPQDEVLLLRLAEASAALVGALLRGETLGSAAVAAQAIDPHVDLTAVLSELLRIELFVGFHVAPKSEWN